MNEFNELTKKTENKFASETYDIVSTVGYLIGVPKSIFENENEPLKYEIMEKLNHNKNARKIRNLSILRTNLERNFCAINTEMRYSFKNLNSLSAYISQESLDGLSADGINIVKANCNTQQYIISINKHICDCINDCKDLFPLWLNWEYLKRIFVMPNGLTVQGIEKAAKTYYSNLSRYPYQQYINWQGEENGNILYNDKKFLCLLYKCNNDDFVDHSKVTGASEATMDNIYRFLDDSKNSIIVVDCENSDPYKLYAMLNNIGEKALISKVKKIILCDDSHTTKTWRILEQFTDMPIEYELIERLKEDKSLVDHKLIAKTCKEVYKNNIDSIILVSSDSDYWGMISEVSDAKFMVMIESGKCGPDIKNALIESDVPYVYIDDFCTGNCYEMTVSVVLSELRHRLNEVFHMNMHKMLNDVCTELRTNMSCDEKQVFYNRFIKSVRLCISETGEATLELGR